MVQFVYFIFLQDTLLRGLSDLAKSTLYRRRGMSQGYVGRYIISIDKKSKFFRGRHASRLLEAGFGPHT